MSAPKPDIPVVRRTNWLLTIPNLVVLVLCVAICYALFSAQIGIFSISLGATIYLIYSFGSRALLTQDHRRGFRLVRQGRYVEAIAAFERSADFFTRYDWLDRFRAPLMLTSTYYGFREMALTNIAFCYAQMGDVARAKSAYERVLRDYPNNGLALSALNLIEAVEKNRDSANGDGAARH
jgi:tetratricopeptide (TPR) repeat protein